MPLRSRVPQFCYAPRCRCTVSESQRIYSLTDPNLYNFLYSIQASSPPGSHIICIFRMHGIICICIPSSGKILSVRLAWGLAWSNSGQWTRNTVGLTCNISLQTNRRRRADQSRYVSRLQVFFGSCAPCAPLAEEGWSHFFCNMNEIEIVAFPCSYDSHLPVYPAIPCCYIAETPLAQFVWPISSPVGIGFVRIEWLSDT